MSLDPNSVKRYKHRKESMERCPLGMWVKVEDYWELKDSWIKQNNLIDSVVKSLKEGGK
ncbi:MAG: hypothetical protein V3W44_09830 [Dehalococcoidales bacterium]